MLKGYKYRLYPNKEQEVQLQKTFGCCRFVYNQTLAYRKEKYDKEYTTFTLYKKNAKKMKQRTLLDTSSFNTNITSCVTTPANRTNSKILLTEMSLLKNRKKHQQISNFSLSKTPTSFMNISRNLKENKATCMSGVSL